MVASKSDQQYSPREAGGTAWVTQPDGCFHPSDSAGTNHELAVTLGSFFVAR